MLFSVQIAQMRANRNKKPDNLLTMYAFLRIIK
nr:MAG TPA: hypothetical protein [Caudoviricetes sp.]